MIEHQKTHEIFFYKTASGKDIILNFIDQLDPPLQAKIRNTLRLLTDYGLKLLQTKSIKKINKHPELFELRITGSKQVRLLFCSMGNDFLITHVFIKKSKKTPPKHIRTAIKRTLEFL